MIPGMSLAVSLDIETDVKLGFTAFRKFPVEFYGFSIDKG